MCLFWVGQMWTQDTPPPLWTWQCDLDADKCPCLALPLEYPHLCMGMQVPHPTMVTRATGWQTLNAWMRFFKNVGLVQLKLLDFNPHHLTEELLWYHKQSCVSITWITGVYYSLKYSSPAVYTHLKDTHRYVHSLVPIAGRLLLWMLWFVDWNANERNNFSVS